MVIGLRPTGQESACIPGARRKAAWGLHQAPVDAVEGAAALVDSVQVPQRLRQLLLLDALHCRVARACTVQPVLALLLLLHHLPC